MDRAVIDGILLAREEVGEGKWPKNTRDYNEYLQPSLIVYHRFTRDPRVLEYLRAYMLLLNGNQGHSTGKAQDLAAYLYWQDGDVKWFDPVGGYEGMQGYMRLFETREQLPRHGMKKRQVSDVLNYPQRIDYETVMDKDVHHTYGRLFYFIAAVDDAMTKGILKPYKGPNNRWTSPEWNSSYWNKASEEEKKKWGWK